MQTTKIPGHLSQSPLLFILQEIPFRPSTTRSTFQNLWKAISSLKLHSMSQIPGHLSHCRLQSQWLFILQEIPFGPSTTRSTFQNLWKAISSLKLHSMSQLIGTEGAFLRTKPEDLWELMTRSQILNSPQEFSSFQVFKWFSRRRGTVLLVDKNS